MIFADYETTARLLFWASYLLTLDHGEQTRLRAEIAAFPPERVTRLEDLRHWPRLRLCQQHRGEFKPFKPDVDGRPFERVDLHP